MVLFRVKWKGYEDPSDITWEPEKVLRCVDHIAAQGLFERTFTDVLFCIGAISRRSWIYISKNEVAEIKL
jgi:hypothetical protein